MRAILGRAKRVFALSCSFAIVFCFSTVISRSAAQLSPGQAASTSTEGAVVIGQTTSLNFPITEGALFRKLQGGSNDGYVTSITFPNSSNPNGQLRFSTYFGGFNTEQMRDVALDSQGNIYITGRVDSTNLPTTPGAFRRSYAGGTMDAFVAKLTPAGKLIFCTYLGGAQYDVGYSIAVDSAGSIYVSGRTSSTNFPVTSGAYQTHYAGGKSSLAPYNGGDAFVVKMKNDGSGLLWSTYVGGASDDAARGRLFVDQNGAVYVEGMTQSANFPTTAGAAQRVLRGAQDAFIFKLSSNGAQLKYSTFLGGSQQQGEGAFGGVAVNAQGETFICGNTSSPDFPTTVGANKRTLSGISDAFLTRLGASGNILSSTLIGGANKETCQGLVLDSAGRPIVLATTSSFNFPSTSGAYQRNFGGGTNDLAVAKFSSNLSSIVFATYIGGSGNEAGDSDRIEIDSSNNMILVGSTSSSGFPVTPGAIRSQYAGGPFDTLLIKLSANGSTAIYSTYLGGGGEDFARSIRYRPN